MTRAKPFFSFAGLLLAMMLAASVAAEQPPVLREHRFFTTPEERAKLDELRHKPIPQTTEISPARVAIPPARAALPTVEINGLVKRSQGPATVWANGQPITDIGKLNGQVTISGTLTDSEHALIILPDRRTIRLQPGETFQPQSGEIDGITIMRSP